MWLVLLAKDLRRAWRNPLPWLINLIVPLAMTGLIGMVFGGKPDSGKLLKIRFAIVDEDNSALTQSLRGMTLQGKAAQYLEPVVMDRETALREINEDKLSGVVIIPANFTSDYLSGARAPKLELIKNPAQSISPTVLEEAMGAGVALLNARAHGVQAQVADFKGVLTGKKDFGELGGMMQRAAGQLEQIKNYIESPLVGYDKEVRAGEPKKDDAKKGDGFNVFAFLLAGMAAMFLLFLAGNGITDLFQELRNHTFERYFTVREKLFPFVAGKVLFTVVLLLCCSAVMFVGGGLIFHIHWKNPPALAALVCGYACFAAGIMACLVSVVQDERRAAVLINIAGMFLGLVGGCAFPSSNLPALLRDHITPLMPSNWFVETVRNLEGGAPSVPWSWVALKLALLGLALIAWAAYSFRKRFKDGVRA